MKEKLFNTYPISFKNIFICIGLIVAVLVVYWRVIDYDFINYDDPFYVIKNQHIQDGFNLKSLSWAFTAIYRGTWQPMVWLSFMLDYQLHGLNAGWFHLTNLLLHIINVLLVFSLFKRMISKSWSGGVVAILFAIHPIHVESVAWISERKDVLSTLFWLLTMHSYYQYTLKSKFMTFLPVILFLALGLMAKPMLVTLPCVLLLLDFWPLKRTMYQVSNKLPNESMRQLNLIHLLFEKIPLFVLIVISSFITFSVQESGGAIVAIHSLPLGVRFTNAIVCYVAYIGKMIWPVHLAILYPHPGMLSLWKITGSGIIIICISIIAIFQVKIRPWLLVGWLWYLGTITPVIGIIQFGIQMMADRFAYIPFIGIYMILAESTYELIKKFRSKIIPCTIMAITLLIFGTFTWFQVGYWSDSIKLYKHTLDITNDNHVIQNNLGAALIDQGRVNEAIKHYQAALHLKPDAAETHNNIAVALYKAGKIDEAMKHYRDALNLNPNYSTAHINIGFALYETGKINDALIHYHNALHINPKSFEAHIHVANLFEEKGSLDKAIEHYLTALQLQPHYAEVHYNLGVVLTKRGKLSEAIHHFSELLRVKPDSIATKKKLNHVVELKRKLQNEIMKK